MMKSAPALRYLLCMSRMMSGRVSESTSLLPFICTLLSLRREPLKSSSPSPYSCISEPIAPSIMSGAAVCVVVSFPVMSFLLLDLFLAWWCPGVYDGFGGISHPCGYRVPGSKSPASPLSLLVGDEQKPRLTSWPIGGGGAKARVYLPPLSARQSSLRPVLLFVMR